MTFGILKDARVLWMPHLEEANWQIAAQVMLDNVKFSYLKHADKSDPLNQLRIIGWKLMYGTLIENQLFFARIESTSNLTTAFG